MKTFTTYAEKKAKQILNLLQGYTKGIRITAILILLLMGVSNAWAGDPSISGFGLQFQDDGGHWFKTGTKGGDGIMDIDLGSKTNLKIVYIYANGNKNGGNICDNSYFKYEIYGETGTQNWGGIRHSSVDWGTPTFKWGSNNSSTAQIDLVKNRKPGDYRMEFLISFEGNSNSNSCGNWYDCKYSGGNWKFSWSIPDPTITITGANALVVGTSTNIKASMSNYPIGATISKIQVSGNTTSKSATGTTDNLTVSSVTPNASGKNGITVTVTVKFGTGGTKDYTYTYDVTPPSVKNFTVTSSGNVISGSGTQNDPYIIKYNSSFTLTLSGSQNHTDANSTIQYNTSGTWNTTQSKTISNINSTDIKNVTVKARYKNNSDANLCGAESSKTIYYRSEQVYTVTFNANGHGTAPAAQTVSQGSKATQPTAPTATGYTFGGWYKESNCTNAFDFNTAINANITLYAKWTANQYTINYKDQGNVTFTGEHASGYPTKHTYGTATTLSTATKTGYTFGGWHTDAACTNKVTSLGATAYTADITLYAKWTANTYTIKFHKNDAAATSTMADQSFTYDETKKLTANAFVKTNWKFAGWNTKADGSGTPYSDQQSVSNLTATDNGVVNLYAQWAPAQDAYTITIRANGNGTVSPESVIVNQSITAEVTATPNEGHKFIGWKTEGGAQVADKERFSTINASRTTVTAANAGSVTALFEPLLPNTLTLTHQPMYKDRKNPLEGAGGDGSETDPYKIYSEEIVRITVAELPKVEELTAYYKFGDNPEQESNVFDFKDISGTTPTNINIKAYYKKGSDVWEGEVSADSYYFLVLPLPFYVSTVPAGEMSLDQAAGQDILVQFRSDKKATVNLYVQKDNGEREFRERIENTASYNFNYPVPDNSGPCVLRFIAESDELLDGRSFSKYAEVALYQNVTIKVNDPNGLLKKVFLWRGDDVKSEWPGEDFIQTFGTWRVFVVKYPYYDHFVLNDGTSDNQTYDYEIPSEDKCYQLSDTKVSEGGYNNYKLNATNCPSDLMVSDIEDVTIMEGEQIVVMPKIYVGLGYQVADIKASVHYENNGSITAMMSGTNVTILGNAEGDSEVTVTYILDNVRIEKTFTVSVTKRTKITIQVKVPTEHGPEADRIGWWKNDKVYVRYWNAQNRGTDQKMNYLTQTDYHYYFEATIPLDDTGKTNFNIFYENRDEDWRYSTNATNVTKDGCYLVYNDGSGDRGLRYEDVRCLTQYQVRIAMGNGKTFTSNIVTAEEDTLSFFAPGMNETGYKAGVIMLYQNDKMVATIEPSTFAKSDVYTATVNETGDGLGNVAPYSGNFYIRTYGTSHKEVEFNNGKGWNSIKDLTAVEKDSVRFTKFASREGEFYNHYWVQAMNSGPEHDGKDVSACVANDYNDDLAGKLMKDKNTTATGDIKLGGKGKTINVRFGYDPRTNYFARAVLLGSEYENYLNMHCDNAYADKNCTKKLPYGNNNNITENKFRDISNWVYERDIYVNITNSTPSASVYVESKSPHVGEDGKNVVYNHLLGYVTNEVTGVESETPIQRVVIGSGTDNGVYLVRVVYDFKTNRLIAAWLPQGTVDVSTEKTIDADVLFVRKENEEVPQINLSSQGKIKSLESMFFAMEFHRVDKNPANRHQEQYWFTLPFDCKVGSISGVHGYMQIWGIQRYNGKKRAENGWFNPSTTFWEWLTPDDVMHAGEGYLLVFDKKTAPWNEIEVDKTDANGNIIEGQKEIISLMRLYFPSTESGFDMQQQSEEQLKRTYENHTCTITTANRDLQDSNWKVIGTTSYNNAGISGYTKDSDPAYKELSDAPSFRYQYEYEMSNDNKTFRYKYTPENGQTATYKSFYGYMVQFAGTINWQPIMSETVPDHIAARRYVPANERTSYTTRLELANAAGEVQDLTFVALDEKATTGFDQNKDLNKVLNRGTNIYTFVEGLPFAGNTLPMEKATVPVGVRVATAGEYTFRMPDGTDGIAVTLVDNVTGTHTNMLMNEYTVTLNAGTIENRFYLVVDPDRTATSVENVGSGANGDEAKGVEKFLIDGKLFIRTADGIFDAKGQRL